MNIFNKIFKIEPINKMIEEKILTEESVAKFINFWSDRMLANYKLQEKYFEDRMNLERKKYYFDPHSIDDSSIVDGNIPNGIFTKVWDNKTTNDNFYAIMFFMPYQHFYVFEKFEVGQTVYHAHNYDCSYNLPKAYFLGQQKFTVERKEPIQNHLYLKIKTDTGYYVIIDNGIITSIEKI